MSVLEVKHVKKYFGNKIVIDDINFTIKAGECLGIVGLSGGGKSTLAKIITRLIPFDGGQIILCGKDILIEKDREIYKKMQMIFQNPEESFNPRRKLGKSIAEPIKNFLGGENLKERVENLLIEVGLPKNYTERYPREVSGGECQRAAIARAISINPKLLICDEATSALDVTIQEQIVALIRKICVEKNIACLFITHDLAILKKLADRVLVLENGQLKTLEKSDFKEVLQWN